MVRPSSFFFFENGGGTASLPTSRNTQILLMNAE
jgi:hypothetical protein